jgi:hypothetical protein
VSFRYDDDGLFILNCRLPAEAGARMMKTLNSQSKKCPRRRQATFQRERQLNQFSSAHVVPMPWPWLPKVFWRMAPWRFAARIQASSYVVAIPLVMPRT